MARLSWNTPGGRFYESGVDRGVLYVERDNGVAWSGLTSVDESPQGGEVKATYLDGVKIRNFASSEEFEATINAFAMPREFRPCDGISEIQNGLFLTQQPRKTFNFSYRTLIGNDVSKRHGYKIHLVYNALASPSSRANTTLGDSSDPSSFSWSVTTRPPMISGHRPTAHVVIDTRDAPSGLIADLETTLYGNDEVSAYLPTIEELITMFQDYVPEGSTP